ncbi:MAG TPA: adenylate/guanylate cyclase domain-containing protein [Burkholderiales bacterium]|nr:adenylate/guanylate cyclase domain-containing protein [Burkholderiales bacterium]
MQPLTRYALSDDVNIAYQVVGDAPLDLVFVMGWVSNIDEFWTEPMFATFLRRLARFSRLIVFDKRGTGLSDRVDEKNLPTLEQRMDDVRAVMDAAGSKRAVLFGISEGGPLCSLFAATYPERASALLMFGTYARAMYAPDYPWGRTEEWVRDWTDMIRTKWGAHPVGIEARVPSRVNDPQFREWWTRYLVRSASPKAVLALTRMNTQVDMRHVLPAIRVPTLIMHRVGDRALPVEGARYMARHIRGAKLVEFPGDDHLPWTSDAESVLAEIEAFVTGTRPVEEADRVLATVMFADIVDSTQRAAAIGDRAWTEELRRFYGLARRQLERFRGREIDTVGDGYFATFDGPARAVRCAQTLSREMAQLGLPIRTGLHTGEVEVIGEKIGGIAVHIGARIAGHAAPGEVVVSNTVKDLVAGSGLQFEDRGVRPLKGVPGEWRLYRASA